MMSFTCHVTDLPAVQGAAVLTVSGTIGEDGLQRFQQQLEQLEQTRHTLIVDLRPATFVYSGALLAIARVHKRAVFDGRRVVVVRPTDETLAKAVRISGLERTVEIIENVAQIEQTGADEAATVRSEAPTTSRT